MLRIFVMVFVIGFVLVFSGCSDEVVQTRSYKMGMANSGPRFDDFDLIIQSLFMWTERADAAIISTEVPWEELLGGMKAKDYAIANYKDLVDFYRSKGFELWIYIDPQNGLDRTSDAQELQAVNKSIADADMQLLYRKFTFVMDSLFHPEHLGLAMETNLIRDAASAAIYNGVKQAANDAANEIAAYDATVKLSVSVQVDHAWGKLAGGTYVGVNQDFTDFPFVDELGLSSYPYLGFNSPSEIPLDYYSKLIEGRSIQVFIAEGGWSSQSVTTPERSFVSSPEIQQQYISHHVKLLERVEATALFQLTFTDIDLDHLPPGVHDNIGYFAFLGLVDKELEPKPALSVWDQLFDRPLKK